MLEFRFPSSVTFYLIYAFPFAAATELRLAPCARGDGGGYQALRGVREVSWKDESHPVGGGEGAGAGN